MQNAICKSGSKEMKNINGEESPVQTTRNCPFGLFGGLCELQVIKKNTVKFLIAWRRNRAF